MITTPRKKKTAKDISKRAKVALLDRRMSVTELAVRLGKPRNTVSMAINRKVFPYVQELIKAELGI